MLALAACLPALHVGGPGPHVPAQWSQKPNHWARDPNQWARDPNQWVGDPHRWKAARTVHINQAVNEVQELLNEPVSVGESVGVIEEDVDADIVNAIEAAATKKAKELNDIRCKLAASEAHANHLAAQLAQIKREQSTSFASFDAKPTWALLLYGLRRDWYELAPARLHFQSAMLVVCCHAQLVSLHLWICMRAYAACAQTVSIDLARASVDTLKVAAISTAGKARYCWSSAVDCNLRVHAQLASLHIWIYLSSYAACAKALYAGLAQCGVNAVACGTTSASCRVAGRSIAAARQMRASVARMNGWLSSRPAMRRAIVAVQDMSSEVELAAWRAELATLSICSYVSATARKSIEHVATSTRPRVRAMVAWLRTVGVRFSGLTRTIWRRIHAHTATFTPVPPPADVYALVLMEKVASASRLLDLVAVGASAEAHSRWYVGPPSPRNHRVCEPHASSILSDAMPGAAEGVTDAPVPPQWARDPSRWAQPTQWTRE